MKTDQSAKAQQEALPWKYIVAWILMFGISNLISFGVLAIAVYSFGYAIGLWVGLVSEDVLRFLMAVVIYTKIFKTLNLKKVFHWLCFLGTLVTMSNLGGGMEDIRELGLDPSGYFLGAIIGWFSFLFLFRYYFENNKNSNWPSSDTGDESIVIDDHKIESKDRWLK
jgi:hypothetical protein